MVMAMVETWVNQDLTQPVRMIYPKGNFFEEDNLGNLIGVRAYNNGSPAYLDGSCVGYCILANGASVPVNGSVSGNTAYIILPQSAYAVPGPICIILKLISGSTVTTLASICTTVVGLGNNVSDPSAAVIAEWTAQINAAISAVQNNSVRYDTSQSLTSTQKAQAKSNIGAVYSAVSLGGGNYRIVVP